MANRPTPATPPAPPINMAAIAEQIGHLTIAKALYRAQGNDRAADAAMRAAEAYLDLALAALGVDPVAHPVHPDLIARA